ncbi:hypothetical protein BDQ17DRAFT_1331395 [Cyathus striatus]|nr:hypothetical protein BDQ17DRAFT_1331395 [Cyathus striatus]
MTEDNCALNCDGTLKDASEIQWHYNSDDKMPLLKNNKRARIEKKFLDIEAKVSSDSEGEEDDEDMDGFINNEDQDEEDPNTSIVRLTLQCSFYAHLQNEDKKQHIMDHLHSGGGDLASLQAEQRIDNHRNLSAKFLQCAVSQASGTSSSSAVSKHNIPRRSRNTKDWPLWSVVVKDGSEEDVVFSLSLHGGSKYIRSAFSLSSPLVTFMWRLNVSTIKTSTRILADVYQNSICAVPATTWDVSFSKMENAIFHPRTHGSDSEEDVCEKTFEIDIVHIPQTISSNLKPPCELFNPKKHEKQARIPLKLFSKIRIIELLKDINLGNPSTHQMGSYCVEATPTIDELWSFESCSLIPKKNLEDTRNCQDGIDVQPYGQIGEEKVTIVTFPIKGIMKESMADREYEARIMREDPYKFLYGQYTVVKFGTRKGDMGIMTFPEIFKGLNIVGDSSLSMNICPMPQWENDLGTGSHTPAWNPSSRTLQISNAAAAEFICVCIAVIPENEESTGHLEPSGPLPPSMQTFVIDHWIKWLVDSDSSQLTMASSRFENGRVPPERRGQLVMVVNHLNHQIYRGEYEVVDLKGEAVFAYPHKGKKRLDRGINIPMGDLAVIAKRR